jgi:glycerol-3-phosphate dehydrogenase
VTVTGGKLTTYRRMAEDTVDTVVKQLGTRAPDGARSCRTKRLRLRGAEGLEALRRPAAGARFGVDDTVFAALVARHGDETPAVLELASGHPELLEPLVRGLPQLRVEALWAVRHEMAMTIDDVLARRTRAVLRRAVDAADAAPALAELLAPAWGRTPADTAGEAAAFARRARLDMARAGLDPVDSVP